MESQLIIVLCIAVLTYGLFSWLIGRFINVRRKKEARELQNFLLGAIIIGIAMVFVTLYHYYGG